MVIVREALPSDQRFVASTMAKQLARHEHPNALVDRILDSPTTHIFVAERGGRIVGWLAHAKIPNVRAMLFVYVRRDDRGKGIATQLAKAAWPNGRGKWVHGGLRGNATRTLLEHFPAVEMNLDELL